MLVLRPGEPGRAVEAAFAPYFDATLAERTQEPRTTGAKMPSGASPRRAAMSVCSTGGCATRRRWSIEAVNAEMAAALAALDLDPPELPEAELDDPDEDEGMPWRRRGGRSPRRRGGSRSARRSTTMTNNSRRRKTVVATIHRRVPQMRESPPRRRSHRCK